MSEELLIPTGSRKEIYESLLPQLKALTEVEPDFVANCANVSAALRQAFGFWWVGFYFVKNHDELVLGPFQGDVACTRIKMGKGVCGTSWEKKNTLIVDDVEQFPGHIACSAASKSEIVVPIFKKDVVIGVLDVDSNKLNDFSGVDKIYLEKIALLVTDLIRA
jgi:L-methionine (R)-S-oxide reductase